jgi:hypothetical protein
LEDVAKEKETHELIKPDKSSFIVIEFPNINPPVVKVKEESSGNFVKPKHF